MRVAVLDIDQSHNLRLKAAFKDNEKVELLFCANREDLLHHLNGASGSEAKIKSLEKILIDGSAMLARATDGILKAQKVVAEKESQLKSLKAEERVKSEAEIAALKVKVVAAQGIKTKIETAMVSRQSELEALRAGGGTFEKKKFDLLFVDRSFLGNLPSDWVIELREKIDFAENKEIPVIAMGYNEDLNYIKNTLHGGVLNYFVKPVDQLLMHQTLGTGEKVFELQTQSQVRILKSATTYKLSEFELYIETDILFRIGELVEFYVDIFGGEKDKRVLARCIAAGPKADNTLVFEAQFMIVGHTPHTMTEMRKWIRARYVTEKKDGQ